MRQIINMFKDPTQSKNRFLVNAEDFSIFRIGTYDKKTGIITSTNLEHIVNMHDLRALADPTGPSTHQTLPPPSPQQRAMITAAQNLE